MQHNWKWFYEMFHEDNQTHQERYEARLHSAIRRNNITQVKQALEQGVNPNLLNRQGCAPLAWAVMGSLSEITQVLLNHEAIEVNITEPNGDTPLHVAVRNQDDDLIKMLLDHGADPNIANIYEETPLFYAVKQHHIENIRWLLEKGAKVMLQDKFGNTPLHLLAPSNMLFCQNENISPKRDKIIVQLLLDHGADPNIKNKSGDTPTLLEFLSNRSSIFTLYLKKGGDPHIPDQYGQTVLHYAATTLRFTHLSRFLLRHKGININIKNGYNRTPLYSAVLTYNTDSVKYLLKNGADIGSEEEQYVISKWYLEAEDVSLFKYFIVAGLDTYRVADLNEITREEVRTKAIIIRDNITEYVKKLAGNIQNEDAPRILRMLPYAIKLLHFDLNTPLSQELANHIRQYLKTKDRKTPVAKDNVFIELARSTPLPSELILQIAEALQHIQNYYYAQKLEAFLEVGLEKAYWLWVIFQSNQSQWLHFFYQERFQCWQNHQQAEATRCDTVNTFMP